MADEYHSDSDEDYVPKKEEEEPESDGEDKNDGGAKRARLSTEQEVDAGGETEAERKARLDALFMAELGLPPKKAAASSSAPAAGVSAPKSTANAPAGSGHAATKTLISRPGAAAASAPPSAPAAKVNITKTYKFAGEAVQVVEAVDAKTAERIQKKRAQPPTALQSLLGAIGPKKSMTTLAKSQIDWEQYKEAEGLSETLKKNHGYLDKVDFLQRADERQHEAELAMKAAVKRR